jgi:glycosyltransferase involved in cell wall biosynthesis
MEITVVFPAYNEAENIRETMSRSLEALRPRFERFEIIIVDDCGSDGTGGIADELAAQYPGEIRVIHNPRNLGSAWSVLEGFAQARYALVTHNSMDYPLDLCDLDKMLPLFADTDIVVATRDQRAGYGSYRKLLSRVNVGMLHLFFPLQLSDYNFTQIYPREFLRTVHVTSRSTGFVTPELMIRAHDSGLRIKPIEITYHARVKGDATSGKPRVVLHSLMDLLRFWWLRLRDKDNLS